MTHHLKYFSAAMALIAGLAFGPALQAKCIICDDTITTVTADGITLYAARSFADLDKSAPLVLLFHQAGSNGRGEYGDIIPWLNAAGYRVLAWDQRAGGSYFGRFNRTALGLPANTGQQYCDARPDLQAAHDYVLSQGLADKMIIWGSSYSAALVFGLAADNPRTVAGLLSFSPATGGPMANCRAHRWAKDVRAPVFVGRPANEMTRESSIGQRAMFEGLNFTFEVFENGVHGSSMLVDSRTNADMSAARKTVLQALDAMAK